MSIPLTIYEGEFNNLSNIEKKEGNIYVCKDIARVFLDITINGTLERIQLGSIQDDNGEFVDVKDYINTKFGASGNGTLIQMITWEEND